MKEGDKLSMGRGWVIVEFQPSFVKWGNRGSERWGTWLEVTQPVRLEPSPALTQWRWPVGSLQRDYQMHLGSSKLCWALLDVWFPPVSVKICPVPSLLRDFPSGSDGKESACNAGDPGSIPGSGRSLGEGNGYPLQCSCLENSMDRRAWRAAVHGVAESQTWLSQ